MISEARVAAVGERNMCGTLAFTIPWRWNGVALICSAVSVRRLVHASAACCIARVRSSDLTFRLQGSKPQRLGFCAYYSADDVRKTLVINHCLVTRRFGAYSWVNYCTETQRRLLFFSPDKQFSSSMRSPHITGDLSLHRDDD